MGFNISPAVIVTEEDLTQHAVPTGDTIGAITGVYQWGPVEDPYLITQGEDELKSVFGKPNSDTAISWLVAKDFLSYSKAAYVQRAVGSLARNAVETGEIAVVVKNDDDYTTKSGDGTLNGIDFLAKFPGEMGNGLKVDIVDSAGFATWRWKDQFVFTPKTGEYAAAIVDGAGTWAGTGEKIQEEDITVSIGSGGAVPSSNTPQAESFTVAIGGGGLTLDAGQKGIQTVTFSGAPTATGSNAIMGETVQMNLGVAHEEDIALTGEVTATGTLTLLGKTVSVTAGDDATAVAALLATALDADPLYSATSALGVVSITYAATGVQTAFPAGASNGISHAIGTITTAGVDETTPALLAQAWADQVNTNGSFSNVSVNGSSVTVTTDDFYPLTKLADEVVNGYTAVSVIVQDGVGIFNATIAGNPVSITFNRATVDAYAGSDVNLLAGEVATILASDSRLDNVIAAANVISYTRTAVGPQTALSTVTKGEVSFTNATVTPGAMTVPFTVEGTPLSISVTTATHENDIATAIATQLALDADIDTATATANKIKVVYTTVGRKTPIVSVTESNVTMNVSIGQVGSDGVILEKFERLTDVADSKYDDGTSSYWPEALNKSKYIRVGDSSVAISTRTTKLAGGVDNNASVDKQAEMDIFLDTEEYSVNYLISADDTVAEQRRLAEIAETRKDCIMFVSPLMSDVVDNAGSEQADCVSWYEDEFNISSSYVFMTGNWGYIYDEYNDVYRWIPTSGGTAGLMARTTYDRDAWYSPAGHNRGVYKNYTRLAWSPNKAQRDELYKVGINPITKFPASGFVLFGDKTAYQVPGSAFGHINVRQAFIVAERSIAAVSKYFLFELNNEFTRAQFRNSVVPALRNIQSRNGIDEFSVIVDERNNPAEVIENNEMAGDILIKPLHSINFITLKFVAVSGTVSFDEIEEARFG